MDLKGGCKTGRWEKGGAWQEVRLITYSLIGHICVLDLSHVPWEAGDGVWDVTRSCDVSAHLAALWMYEKEATRVQRLVGRQEMMADWPPGGRGSLPFAHVQCGPDPLENVPSLHSSEVKNLVVLYIKSASWQRSRS